MKQIQTNAQQLMTFSIFSDKNSFTYNNIVKTGKDFEKVADVSLYLVNNKAAGSFVNYYYTFYFALIMMVFIIYGLSGERDNGMWGLYIRQEAEGFGLRCTDCLLSQALAWL